MAIQDAPPLNPFLQQAALASLVDGLGLIDSTGRVAFWNSCATDLLHWSAEAMVGCAVNELIERVSERTNAPDAIHEQLRAALANAETEAGIEMTIPPLPDAPNPGLRVVMTRVFPLHNGAGQWVGTGILWHDVTREREVDAMKTQLLSTVSHELRTPLASIKGFATTLLRQDVKWDEATQRDFLRIIEEESDRLTEIIDNLLDMSQIEAGALRIEKEPMQLRTLIRDVVDDMRMRTEAHYFVTDLPTMLPRVLADARRIRQVLRNLLENALKYTKSGQIAITCEVESAQVLVSVSDQGPGIPPEFLDKIFERFFQVDGASTRRVGGSGLGLSISLGIIQAHGGKIWAENNSPQGSIFRFTLPLAPEDSNE